jgi:thymidylate synthase
MYTVTDPDYTMIGGVHEEWVAQEWADRLAGELNPGKAWRLREDVWRQFLTGLEASRRFDYTYSQRMGGKHIQRVIEEINEHPESRQLYLPVWSEVDERRRGLKRVPCSLGYWFNLRKGRLNLTYMMRSCDFFTHYPNDVALAAMLLRYVADETGYDVGSFTHYIGAFHVFEKDVSHVF